MINVTEHEQMSEKIVTGLSKQLQIQDSPLDLILTKRPCNPPVTPGEGVLPYLAYKGMCRWTGYGFLNSLS